jgi:chromosome partitioning protein
VDRGEPAVEPDTLHTPEVLPAGSLPPPGSVIAVYMQKGGTGKTETARGMGEALARYGVPVVLVDLDPHAALTAGLGLELATGEANLARLLTGDYQGSIEHLLVPRAANLHVVPSSVDMPLVEQQLSSVRFREERLRMALQPLLDRYVVVLDCPNNPGLLNDNALFAAASEKDKTEHRPGGLLIVLQLEGTSMHSLELLLDQVDSLNQMTRYEVAVLGWFANLVDPQTRITRRTRAALADLPMEPLGEMPRRVAIKEAWDKGQLVGEYDPRSDALPVYRQLAWRVMGKLYG